MNNEGKLKLKKKKQTSPTSTPQKKIFIWISTFVKTLPILTQKLDIIFFKINGNW